MDERAAIQWFIFAKELAFIIVNAPDFDHAIHLRKPIHLLARSATMAIRPLPRQLQ